MSSSSNRNQKLAFVEACNKLSTSLRGVESIPKTMQTMIDSVVLHADFESFAVRMKAVAEQMKAIDDETESQECTVDSRDGRWIAPFTWLPSSEDDEANAISPSSREAKENENEQMEFGSMQGLEGSAHLAKSFIQADEAGRLPEQDMALLPWASTVIRLHDILKYAPLSGQRHPDEEAEIGNLVDKLRMELPKVKGYISRSADTRNATRNLHGWGSSAPHLS